MNRDITVHLLAQMYGHIHGCRKDAGRTRAFCRRCGKDARATVDRLTAGGNAA